MLKRVGFGVLVANFSVGNVPSELTQRSMTLFAKEVMPRLRPVNSDLRLQYEAGSGRAQG